MAQVLFRMSYSSIIRESEDLGAGLFLADGREICESDSTPMHIGSLPWYIRGFMQKIGNDLDEGDVIIHNHPYYGASHSPDIAVVIPIFHQGELIAFSGVTGHVLDIGGAAPGINVNVVDVFAEGKLYNAVKLYKKGVRNEELWEHIIGNVRTPYMNTGDIEAMVAACRQGEKRLKELINRYGVDTVLSVAEDWMDYSEAMIRKQIAALPDGVYEAPIGYLDDDGLNRDKRLPVCVKVIIEGDEITIDLTGSSPEVETGYNVPYHGSTLVAAYCIIRMILLDEFTSNVFVPQNDGIFRPIKVIAPEGSIFNPRFPRACFARFNQVQRMADSVLQALAPILPNKVTAGNSAHTHFVSYSGFDEATKQYWMYLEVQEGSYGARYGKDGIDTIDNLIANTRNNPIEELEMRIPMRTERYEIRPESSGHGKWRGGRGVIRANRWLVDGYFSCEADRHFDPPRGLFGGHDGLVGKVTRNPGTEHEEELPSKVTGARIRANDLLEFRTPSGAGFGSPLERDPNAVLEDVLDDYITVDEARAIYGVVIDIAEEKVDKEATEALRKEMIKNHPPVKIPSPVL
jgi:N-methylhydantoinase B/oxoprolinase/acetone carboxylase alpha subunit